VARSVMGEVVERGVMAVAVMAAMAVLAEMVLIAVMGKIGVAVVLRLDMAQLRGVVEPDRRSGRRRR